MYWHWLVLERSILPSLNNKENWEVGHDNKQNNNKTRHHLKSTRRRDFISVFNQTNRKSYWPVCHNGISNRTYYLKFYSKVLMSSPITISISIITHHSCCVPLILTTPDWVEFCCHNWKQNCPDKHTVSSLDWLTCLILGWCRESIFLSV